MTKKTMILPETALSKYLELGQGRSLNKLHKTLGNNAPSYDTLKRWCNRFDWVKIAQETDYKARNIPKKKFLFWIVFSSIPTPITHRIKVFNNNFSV